MSNLYKKHTDVELVNLFNEESRIAEAAFTELYNRHSSMIHAYCVKVLDDRDAAEDVFQETFIRFFKNVKENPKVMNVPGFLITIARNLCLNQKRDKKQTVSVDDYEYVVKDYQNYEKKELLDLINRTLELLDDDLREAFVLREYSGMQYNEIAEATATSLVNAKSRVFRAKQKIRTILQPYLQDLQNN